MNLTPQSRSTLKPSGVWDTDLKYNKKYNKDIYEVFDIKGLISKELLIDDGINIYIPLDKMYISNEILVNFIKE